jgi:hypothetical protein
LLRKELKTSKTIPSLLTLVGLLVLLPQLLLADTPPAQDPRLIEILPREELDRTKVALNAFANQPEFGTPSEQFREIRSTLGVKRVRLLFAWTEDVQPTPGSPINHSFNTELIRSLPKRVKALVVLANLPSWMSNSSNWLRGDPVLTFYRRWVKPNVRRYRRKRKIEGFQIFNEPNSSDFFENQILGTDVSPEKYRELLKKSYRFIKRRSQKKVVGAATTSLLQNFPETLEYNQTLIDLGIEDSLDVFAIHIYGSSVERYFLGIDTFLKGLTKPIWVTESGRQGVDEQLNYVERVWPFLSDEVPSIERFYYYRFAEVGDNQSTFGLKNTSIDSSLSDLYQYLKNTH